MVVAILQARCSSTRLPGKVLHLILGKPMLLYEISRIKQCRKIDRLVVATSLSSDDDTLASLCLSAKVDCFRGSLNDVLDRFYKCAKKYKAEHVVRLTGDCPMIDWNYIDSVIEKHLKEKNDYTSNALLPTFPDGLDVEVVKFSALEIAWKEARLPSEREHVTPFIYKNSQRFHLGCLQNEKDLSSLRWTVDEPEDFIFITKIYENLYVKKQNFTMQDILDFLIEHPEMERINQHFHRNEGYACSLEMDQSLVEKEDRDGYDTK